MKVAIMQPYFLPYIGYFQLIHAVDTFVVYDDTNYIKGGWINRNFLLEKNRRQRMTLSLKALSSNKKINQIDIVGDVEKLLKSIHQNYAKSPNFNVVFPVIENLLLSQERNLAHFLDNCLRQVCEYLELIRPWYMASSFDIAPQVRGQERVLAICQTLDADHYINLPGGRELYEHEAFEKKGMKLSFIDPAKVEYHQFGGEFVPNLSILDVIMFNDKATCNRLLQEYKIV